MSKEIDWSKAPEGATHYAPKREENCMWRAVFWRIEDGRGVEAWSVNNDDSLQYYGNPTWIASDIGRLIERPSFASWTGTGLPPVGTVCEMQHEDWNHGWEKVLVLYTSSAYVITDDAKSGEQHWYTRNLSFRPIRTPEQIAAEEREKAVSDMLSMWMDCGSARDFCEYLHDHGYRKTEVGK